MPGDRKNQFCKPTAVAVTKDDIVFIADGYCNSRVMIYDSEGQFLNEIPISITQATATKLQTPRSLWTNSILHSLTLMENDTILCLSMREIFLISCHNLTDNFKRSHLFHKKQNAVYSIVASDGHILHAVGAIRKVNRMNQFAVNIRNNEIVYDTYTELVCFSKYFRDDLHFLLSSLNYDRTYV